MGFVVVFVSRARQAEQVYFRLWVNREILKSERDQHTRLEISFVFFRFESFFLQPVTSLRNEVRDDDDKTFIAKRAAE
jgi:hypothetical protein